MAMKSAIMESASQCSQHQTTGKIVIDCVLTCGEYDTVISMWELDCWTYTYGKAPSTHTHIHTPVHTHTHTHTHTRTHTHTHTRIPVHTHTHTHSDQMGNNGAFITLTKDLKPEFTSYEAVVSLHVSIFVVPLSI